MFCAAIKLIVVEVRVQQHVLHVVQLTDEITLFLSIMQQNDSFPEMHKLYVFCR